MNKPFMEAESIMENVQGKFFLQKLHFMLKISRFSSPCHLHTVSIEICLGRPCVQKCLCNFDTKQRLPSSANVAYLAMMHS